MAVVSYNIPISV